MFTIDFSPFIAQLEAISEGLPASVSNALDTLGEMGASSAKSSRLFKGNGPLRKEIAVVKKGAFVRQVVSPTSYAKWVEYGNNQNGPRIYPKRAKALRFVVNGKVIFRKSVRAHGPLPYMGTARMFIESFAADYLQNNLSQLADSKRK